MADSKILERLEMLNTLIRLSYKDPIQNALRGSYYNFRRQKELLDYGE